MLGSKDFIAVLGMVAIGPFRRQGAGQLIVIESISSEVELYF
jgi:hypothetical protein